jgi:5-methylthioadenosine/S-adenosylhomocysteine deaminase
MELHLAKFVLPVTTEPIPDGAIAVDGDTIAGVGTASDLKSQFSNTAVTDHGNAAILPGFVNCHSHLELTEMRGSLDNVEHDFRSWLLKLNDLRSQMLDDEIYKSALAGVREGARAGVSCFGDIGRNAEAGLKALKAVGLRGVVFQETEFSPDNRTADDDFKKLATKYESLLSDATDLVSIGISPHSPYTVSSRLFELIAQYAILNRILLTIHAAESASENELLGRGTGFFTEVYEKFDLEWHSPHCPPIEYLEKLGVLSTKPLLAHCVHVSDGDINRIADNGAKIAHCPKSNAKFGHGAAPLEKFLDNNITVGLGSDSVASNNVCDILEESRFATLMARNREASKRFISAKEALELATLGGARALDLDSQIGSLEVGKQADIAVISLDNEAQQPTGDIHAALVFSSNARDVRMTMVAGTIVYNSQDARANNQ